MREKLKVFFPIWKWARVQMIVIIILTAIICLTIPRDYEMIRQTQREADGAYSEAMKIHKKNGNKVEEPTKPNIQNSESKAISLVSPEVGQASRPVPAVGIDEILPKIYQLESSSGKNDDCKLQGKVNGFGFRINKFEHKCYASKEEVEKEVAAWFDKNLKTKTLSEALCYYNTGQAISNCEYQKKFYRL